MPWSLALLSLGFAIGVMVARQPPAAPPDRAWVSYADVYAAVAPVVLNVSVDKPERRIGSGFALSDELVVTARHLVFGAKGPVTVRTIDGGEHQARVVGTDARTDLALLEAEGASFKPATLGRSSDLAVGDTVLAIGNPYGLGHSLAVGVLSSRGRRLADPTEDEPQVDFMQLTMPLNPGNSGGPLFDEKGQVVGVLTGTHAMGQSIAFAVPVEVLRKALPALMKGARITNAFLGVRTEAAARGVQVVQVAPSGPAGRAGIRPGDIIEYVGKDAVHTPAELRAVVDARPVTSYVFIRLLRDGNPVAVDVGLEDRAEQPLVVAGMVLRPVAGAGGEVVAVRPRSRADDAGVKQGDVIRTVNGVPAQAPADVEEMLASGEAARLELTRDDTTVTIQLGEAPSAEK